MKRKVLAMFLVMVIGITCNSNMRLSVQAEEMGEDIEFSELLTEDTLVGTTEMQTWGVYLAEGNSYISKMSSNKIGIGGDTIAAKKCKVSVTSTVERLYNGSWVRVTSYSATTASGYSAILSKSLIVATGYYYRVRSTHYASTDVSTSCTSALWMWN